MPINVAEALCPDTAIILPVTRKTGGYVGGVYEIQSTQTFNVLISWQQPSDQQLQDLDENERNQDIRAAYCNKAVYTARDRNGSPADEIVYKGDTFKVIAAGDWIDYGYYSIILAKEVS